MWGTRLFNILRHVRKGTQVNSAAASALRLKQGNGAGLFMAEMVAAER